MRRLRKLTFRRLETVPTMQHLVSVTMDPNSAPTLPSLAYTTTCHICDKTYVSVLRPFPTPYVCPGCDPDRDARHAAWLAKHPRCKHGHLLTPETVYWPQSKSHAECRLCKKISDAKRRRR